MIDDNYQKISVMRKYLSIVALLLPVFLQALPFVTTPSPSTYPIHWYLLKINGKFLYANSGEWTDVEASSTATADDAYLWCFVTAPSGKTLIFNKAKRKYMSGGYMFTDNMSQSNINYVEMGNGDSFYICFKAENTTFYLNYDNDNGLHSPSWKMNTFTAFEALYQPVKPTPNGELSLNLEVLDEYCMLQAVYSGDEVHTIKLYVNGQNVNNPYKIQRTYENQVLKAKATVEFNDMDPLTTETNITVPARELKEFAGEIKFDVIKNEKNYVIEAYYDGPESYWLTLYANNQEVPNPYSIARTSEDQHVTMKARVGKTGYVPIEAEEEFTIPKYEEPELDLTFTIMAVSSNVSNPLGDEGVSKLFDKNPSTKCRVVFENDDWQPIFVEFRSDKAFVPAGYVMTTGNDTHSYPNRNPKSWKIYGKENFLDDDWILLASVSDGAAAGLGTDNTTEYSFDIVGLKKEFIAFRFVVSEVCGAEPSSNNHAFQLAELRLKGKTSPAEITGDVNGDGEVSVADVTLLVDLLLNQMSNEFSDVNGDGETGVADLTALVGILMTNNK